MVVLILTEAVVDTVDVSEEICVLDKLVDCVELIELLPEVVAVLVRVDEGVELNDELPVLLKVELLVELMELVAVMECDELADEL